jgi:hypothetical protein
MTKVTKRFAARRTDRQTDRQTDRHKVFNSFVGFSLNEIVYLMKKGKGAAFKTKAENNEAMQIFAFNRACLC